MNRNLKLALVGVAGALGAHAAWYFGKRIAPDLEGDDLGADTELSDASGPLLGDMDAMGEPPASTRTGDVQAAL